MTNGPDLHGARDALDWMSDKKSSADLILFRGQTQIWPSVLPTLMRPGIAPHDRERWQDVTANFVGKSNQVTGHPVGGPHHALGLIQHYLGKSTVIDVTGTPEIALYFALNSRVGQSHVVYAIDAEKVAQKGYVVTNHDQLILPKDLGGLKHRWLRQDGFTIGVEDWSDTNAYSRFDFLDLEPDKFEFESVPMDDAAFVKSLLDLESLNDDPLVARVRSVFEEQGKFLGEDHQRTVQKLLTGSATIDAQTELEAEIRVLVERAEDKQFSDADISEIQKLLDAAQMGYWDMSWDAGLDYWKKRVGS